MWAALSLVIWVDCRVCWKSISNDRAADSFDIGRMVHKGCVAVAVGLPVPLKSFSEGT
jgi:hypothetical protein